MRGTESSGRRDKTHTIICALFLFEALHKRLPLRAVAEEQGRRKEREKKKKNANLGVAAKVPPSDGPLYSCHHLLRLALRYGYSALACKVGTMEATEKAGCTRDPSIGLEPVVRRCIGYLGACRLLGCHWPGLGASWMGRDVEAPKAKPIAGTCHKVLYLCPCLERRKREAFLVPLES